ncbi:MAG: hypothetical protein AAFM92_07240 [Pseudomonadota bacterium]
MAGGAFDAIDRDLRANEPGFAETRCLALKDAVTVYAQIFSANPVYGRDESKRAAFDWAQDLELSRVGANKDEKARLITAYLDYFGPVTASSLVPNLDIYQRDKAYCLERFSRSDE